MKKVAISIGDLNGIGISIALQAHKQISKKVHPVYIIDKSMLKQAATKLGVKIPKDFHTISPKSKSFTIKPGKVSKKSGAYSFASFNKAISLAKKQKVDAICTLPIHKEAWLKAGVDFVGHTDYLRYVFKKDAIMMLGCSKLYVALYSEHIPLKDVAKSIKKKKLIKFLISLANSINPTKPIGVLGLNPHAGDNGVLGDEESIINQAIKQANQKLGNKIFVGALVPDIAFTPHSLSRFDHLVALYHDQGLAPLKALYFDESINVSLNLPILRTSVDHGTAFDIAYSKTIPNTKSYINAIEYIASAK